MQAHVIFPAETWGLYVKRVFAKQEKLWPDFLKDELRRWLEMIVTLTPPESSEQGRKAVQRDIGKLVRPLDVDTFREPSVRALIERRDVGAFNAFASHTSMAGAKIMRAEDVPAYHQQHRDTRGRVRLAHFANVYVWGADQIRVLGNYIAHKKNNVGMAIAGWLPSLSFLGGYVSKPVSILDLPEHGSYRETLSHPTKPSIDAVNSTPWAARRDEGQRIISNARAARIQAVMTRLKYLTEGSMKSSASHQSAA